MNTAYFPSIDLVLGDRADRYFGDGHTTARRTVQILKRERRVEGEGFIWQAAVECDSAWSSKAGIQQRPHLTTIDVIELALQCLHSAVPNKAPSASRQACRLHCMRIMAGTVPVEGDLSSLVIAGLFYDTSDDLRLLELQIANMKVTIGYSLGVRQCDEFESTERQKCALRDVFLHRNDHDSENMIGGAVLCAHQTLLSGAWSLSSCFAGTLQLGQALLYELDGIQRDETNTLWMKRTAVIVTNAAPRFEDPQPIHVRLRNARKYSKANGEWRRADIVGLVANNRIICSVTHRLPDEQPGSRHGILRPDR